jgi:hypothetical protein
MANHFASHLGGFMYYDRQYYIPHWIIHPPYPWHYGYPIGPFYNFQNYGSQISNATQSVLNYGAMSGSAGTQTIIQNNRR